MPYFRSKETIRAFFWDPNDPTITGTAVGYLMAMEDQIDGLSFRIEEGGHLMITLPSGTWGVAPVRWFWFSPNYSRVETRGPSEFLLAFEKEGDKL